MVAIRMIIALGALLASAGCSVRYSYPGDWRGERQIAFAPGTQPSAALSLRRVQLKVQEDGRFTLIDMSLPMEGRLDLGAKRQSLTIDLLAGMRAERALSGTKPTYELTWVNDDTLSLSGGPAGAIQLSRQRSPAGSK